jgi:DNA-binding MarR family transcriptional regulator
MKQRTVDAIRAFNRFYTGIIGLLDRHLLRSEFNLPEARVLYELYHQEGILAGDIILALGMDKGYLSRMLEQFGKKKLILKSRSISDGRSVHLSLTAKGKKAFEALNQASNDQIRDILSGLPEKTTEQLVYHMQEIKKILSENQPDGKYN